MKARFIAYPIICVLAIWGCVAIYHSVERQSPIAEPESRRDQIYRFKQEADGLVRNAITNEIVGIRSILEVWVNTFDDDPNKWTAKAKVEHFNRVGGVDRVDMKFKFYDRAMADLSTGRRSLICVASEQ